MPTNHDSQFDDLLSHSAKDKAVVRPLAERLRADELKVPFNFGIRLGTFRFCDSLNRERRFILLRLDDTAFRRRRSSNARHCGMRNTRFLPISSVNSSSLTFTC
jgi:hypothetical protein